MKRIACFLLCLCLILGVFSGCGNDYLSQYIYFKLDTAPVTLDPQSASSESELLIARNLYEGLLRKSDSGAIVCGACKDFDKKGLTYTFNLREDIVWNDGTPVTADDFVFGIQRGLEPATKSPFANRLLSIKGAKQFNKGNADASSLGIKAVNDKTLKIELEFDDPDFKSALTTSVAMPCNRDFFEQSGGKYGRDVDNVLSNGSYFIAKWNKEEFGIRLYKNEEYNGEFISQNAAVFLSLDHEEGVIDLLHDNTIDMTLLDNADIAKAKEKGFKIHSVNNICWVLTLGDQFNDNIKKALALAISQEKALGDGFSVAGSIYPDIIKENTSEDIAIQFAYDIETAKQILSAEISKSPDKKFPQTTLYYYDDAAFKPCVTAVVGHWQKNLSAFINIEASNNLSALSKELTAGELPLAIFPVYAKSTSGAEYLINYGLDLHGSNKTLFDAQQEILKGNKIIPLAYEKTNIVCTDVIKEVYIDDENGYIDFSFIVKQD